MTFGHVVDTAFIAPVSNAAVRPEGFDLAAHWEASVVRFKADLPRYPVTLRATPDIVPHIRRLRYTQVKDVSQPDADGWVAVSVQFETEDEACKYVLGFGSQVEVIEPPMLRQRVIDAAESIVALYSTDCRKTCA